MNIRFLNSGDNRLNLQDIKGRLENMNSGFLVITIKNSCSSDDEYAGKVTQFFQNPNKKLAKKLQNKLKRPFKDLISLLKSICDKNDVDIVFWPISQKNYI